MKSINFKRKESPIRSLENNRVRPRRKPINWDRLVYFVILFLFVFFVGKYLVNKLLYVEGNGQVLFDSVDIRNTRDCRIIEFFVEEGEEVKKGDSLFSFAPADEFGGYGGFGGFGNARIERIQEKKTTGDISWAEREIFAVQQELKLNAIQSESKKKLLTAYQAELARLKNAIALDAMPSYRLDDQEDAITKLELDIQNLQSEQAILKNELVLLRGMTRDLGSTSKSSTTRTPGGIAIAGGSGGKSDRFADNMFYSPLNGTVTNMMKKEFEVALKSESILSLHKPKNVYIKAFFPQEDLKWLKEGQLVNLEFPDGSTSNGVIRRFYFATYRLPEEFQKKYEPTTRSLSADIYPVNPTDLQKWKAFWKMGVKITKYKF